MVGRLTEGCRSDARRAADTEEDAARIEDGDAALEEDEDTETEGGTGFPGETDALPLTPPAPPEIAIARRLLLLGAALDVLLWGVVCGSLGYRCCCCC